MGNFIGQLGTESSQPSFIVLASLGEVSIVTEGDGFVLIQSSVIKSSTIQSSGNAQVNIESVNPISAHINAIGSSNVNIEGLIVKAGRIDFDGQADVTIKSEVRKVTALNLFLRARELKSSITNIPLSITGIASGTSPFIENTPLFIQGDPFSTFLNAFIAGFGGLQDTSGSMNLFINSFAPSISNQIDLFLFNSATLLNNDITLFVQGLGTLPGSVPQSGTMNLFIDVNPGVSESMTAIILGQDILDNDTNLHIFGVSGIPSDEMNMFMRGITNFNAARILFVRGFLR